MRRARLGISPACRRGRMTFQSAASQPMSMTRGLAMGGTCQVGRVGQVRRDRTGSKFCCDRTVFAPGPEAFCAESQGAKSEQRGGGRFGDLAACQFGTGCIPRITFDREVRVGRIVV